MEDKENIKLAFFLNLGFSLFELIGGFLTNSISILSDAVHDFGDSIAIGISFILEKISTKESNKKYTYGYKRYSIIGALITSVILLLSSLFVLFNAVVRIFNPVEIKIGGMLIFAIFGIAINGYAAYKTSKSVNMNEKSVNLHMLEDVLGWIAILVGALVIKATGWSIIDPILSILVALFIGYKSIKNVVDVLNVILEKTPSFIDEGAIKEKVKELNHVLDIHHIHIWSIDGNDILLTMHVLVDKSVTKKNYETIKNNIKQCLIEFGINHSTLEIEYVDCNDEKCD